MMIDTGRYLSILSKIGPNSVVINVPSRGSESIQTESLEATTEHKIRSSYEQASRALFDLAVGPLSIFGRLNSILNYFLLRKADFLVHFLDTAEQELRASSSTAPLNRLDALLDLSIRTSCLANDQHSEPVHSCFLDCDLMSYITSVGNQELLKPSSVNTSSSSSSIPAFELLTLDREMPWPLTVPADTKKSLQRLFHHIFYLKFIERALCNVGRGYMQYHRKHWAYKSTSFDIATVFALRQRMLHFVQNLLYFTCIDVIEPNWATFIGSMQHLRDNRSESCNVANIDLISFGFSEFVESCMEDGLLTMRILLKSLQQMTDAACCTVSGRLAAASDNMLTRLDYNRYYRDFEEQSDDVCAF
ncbi:hypothetical protein ACOME3_006828 [Neoechinorhynchus agilis]